MPRDPTTFNGSKVGNVESRAARCAHLDSKSVPVDEASINTELAARHERAGVVLLNEAFRGLHDLAQGHIVDERHLDEILEGVLS